jgi:hypothetical protein
MELIFKCVGINESTIRFAYEFIPLHDNEQNHEYWSWINASRIVLIFDKELVGKKFEIDKDYRITINDFISN